MECIIQTCVDIDRCVVEISWPVLREVYVPADETSINEEFVVGEGVRKYSRWSVRDNAVHIYRHPCSNCESTSGRFIKFLRTCETKVDRCWLILNFMYCIMPCLIMD